MMPQLADEARPRGGPELILERLTKRYGEFPAVQDVSLEVCRGEFITILGPSGSGKTTTLMMIAGFDYPTAGSVFFRNQNVTYMPAHRRNIGMVFQNYALFPHMSVLQNIAFPLKMRHITSREINERVAAALRLVRLTEHASKPPSQLSGGQQQRVALARALVFDPSLLLMDEPLGALDKAMREQMQVEIKRLQAATGVTIISVTHDQDEALAMSDRIVVMGQGKVEIVGTPSEIYEHPSNRLVAEFMKEVNILEGRVSRSYEGGWIVDVGGKEVRVAHRASEPRSGTATAAICVRPERIQITTEGGQATNQWAGKVVNVVYLGDIVKYHVRLEEPAAAAELVVKQLGSGGRQTFARGDKVVTAWSADDGRLLGG